MTTTLLINSWVLLAFISISGISLPYITFAWNFSIKNDRELALIWFLQILITITLGLWIAGTLREPRNLVSEIMALICSIWLLGHLIFALKLVIQKMKIDRFWDKTFLIIYSFFVCRISFKLFGNNSILL